MRKLSLIIDDSLIISRLQQKELLQVKSATGIDALFFPIVTKLSLTPFFDNLPINFGFHLETIGNQIIGVKVEKGFFAHGSETHMATLAPIDAITAIERLKLKAPIFFQIAFQTAWEDLTEWPREPKTKVRISIALEFARIMHHLEVIRNIFLALELSAQAELAEYCLQLLHKPSRVFLRLHARNSEVTKSVGFNEIDHVLNEMQQVIEDLIASANVETKIFSRLSKKGVINSPLAGALGLTGPFLRSNRHYYDLRHLGVNQLYETTPKISVTEGGDTCARFFLRLFEVESSVAWLKSTIDTHRKELATLDPILINEECLRTEPCRNFAFGEVDAPEGDTKVNIFIADDNTRCYRIRSPAYYIAQAIPHLLQDLHLSEMATILYSLGITADEVDK